MAPETPFCVWRRSGRFYHVSNHAGNTVQCRVGTWWLLHSKSLQLSVEGFPMEWKSTCLCEQDRLWIAHTGTYKLESGRRQCDEAQRDMSTSNIWHSLRITEWMYIHPAIQPLSAGLWLRMLQARRTLKILSVSHGRRTVNEHVDDHIIWKSHLKSSVWKWKTFEYLSSWLSNIFLQLNRSEW